MEVGGDKFRTQKSKVDQIKDNIALINEQIIKSQVEKSNTEKDIVRFKKSLAKGEEELEDLNSKIESYTEEIQQKAEVIRSIRAKSDEAKSVFIWPCLIISEFIFLYINYKIFKFLVIQVLEEKKDELDTIEAKFNEQAERINEIRTIEVNIIYISLSIILSFLFTIYFIQLEIKNELEDSERKLAENKQKADFWRNSMIKLSLYKIR